MSNQALLLASTSIFRMALLKKLHLNFSTFKPNIDESSLADEPVSSMVSRLSLEKAHKATESNQQKIIIASDQAASFQGKPIGKPHNYKNAVKQLTSFSGKTIVFYTGLAVIDQNNNNIYQDLEETKVSFRDLSQTDIHNYLTLEEPYQCAGSFKSEGLGISLFAKIETNDPNALIGLPLIKLVDILKKIGLQIPPTN